MNINLTGQKILVTGASSGIGYAIAGGLAESGATVAVHYNSNASGVEELRERHKERVVPFKADLGQHEQTFDLFHRVLEEFGQLDGIVNNAGTAISSDPEGEDGLWMDSWSKTMRVNLDAVGILCKKAVSHFKQRGQGRIVNISSRAAFRGDTPEYFAYGASKAGMLILARSIASHYGKYGIKTFNIAPGFTRTGMAQDFIDQYGEAHALSDIALDRMTEPGDIAPFVVFLLSGMADHATGCTIDINAGSYMH